MYLNKLDQILAVMANSCRFYLKIKHYQQALTYEYETGKIIILEAIDFKGETINVSLI